ncbi:glycosyltransferase [Rhodohalobacter sulfatireducens]|uniref:Glycosyltransferase n=1 Tax=Rhodohalobacter sulfatireducens TaxID=2911366 RepID=A0ABS9KBX6_9BACT|nr:glycosyltransferase [Rhodohalobacter sulfatireducens]MCG2588330.1 glycosyltransferase [Rhodohalobacter sulfatireducens]
MFYSIIIPVYNRPDEIYELLESLTKQTYTNFEVLIVEDGSEKTSKDVVDEFSNRLNISYYYKDNSGQGFSRNYGFERANGEYYVMFDSDCIIPQHYFETVNAFLSQNPVDAWGGPDRAHPSFTQLQKAINFSMTSFFTTGGIRGLKRKMGTFHPRSFNMGISREVYEKIGGYKITRMGEDLEFSMRIIKSGFKSALIADAYVYHKRRTSLRQFFWQLHFFGRARINIRRFYPEEVKLVHLFPTFFFIGLILSVAFLVLNIAMLKQFYLLYILYAILLFASAFIKEKSFKIALLSIVTAFTQLSAYSIGFLSELSKDLLKKTKI